MKAGGADGGNSALALMCIGSHVDSLSLNRVADGLDSPHTLGMLHLWFGVLDLLSESGRRSERNGIRGGR